MSNQTTDKKTFENGTVPYTGFDCKHLLRSDTSIADRRCAIQIERFKRGELVGTKNHSWVNIDDAAELLNTSPADIKQQIKSGKLESKYDDKAQPLIQSPFFPGMEYPFCEAARKLALSETQLNKKIESGEVKSRYLESDLRVKLIGHWDDERCGLSEKYISGYCVYFEPKDEL